MTSTTIDPATEPTRIADKALFSPAGEAIAYYDWLREHAPVFRHEESGVYYITGYEQCRYVFSHPELFRSPMDDELKTRHFAEQFNILSTLVPNDILNTSGDTHDRLRSALSPAFAPHRVKIMRERVQTIVADLLDKVLDQLAAGEVINFHDAISLALPLNVMGELIGVPPADRYRLKEISSAVQLIGNPAATDEDRQRGMAKFAELTEYFDALIEQRRREPADDLISQLIERTERDDEFKLTDVEVRSMCYVMQIAGYDTTVASIDNVITTLLAKPELWSMVDDERSATKLVEEVLRWNATSKAAPGIRFCTADTELAGVVIPADAEVHMVLGGAHRDPSVFESPERIDITRRSSPALTFGSGIHFCVGAPLAKLEMSQLLVAMSERLTNLEPAGDPVESVNPLLVAYSSVPVRLAAGEAPRPAGGSAEGDSA